MILIADSGSSKTAWSSINNSAVAECITSGINPFFLDSADIIQLLKNEFTLGKENLQKVFFYGAGCVHEKKQVIYKALRVFFNTDNISVDNDLLGAARALCQNKPGIVCILGTGSNSCYYNGNEITRHISPLGYILGDEGSGAVLGKRLVADILKNQLPKDIRDDFFTMYLLTEGEIMENVYRKPFPNRFLAQFTKFIDGHIDKPELNELVNNCFKEFIHRNIMKYGEQVLHLPINFTGSVACIFRANLENVLNDCGLSIGKVTQSPMAGLIEYHLNIS
ncbi:MAG: ATPase [Prevotellaceae bacterium]|jgi:N-acetylglucosamine kinase-like BadF-type ATPase|nr:ATPase [Prevotellaceae bacterium]